MVIGCYWLPKTGVMDIWLSTWWVGWMGFGHGSPCAASFAQLGRSRMQVQLKEIWKRNCRAHTNGLGYTKPTRNRSKLCTYGVVQSKLGKTGSSKGLPTAKSAGRKWYTAAMKAWYFKKRILNANVGERWSKRQRSMLNGTGCEHQLPL